MQLGQAGLHQHAAVADQHPAAQAEAPLQLAHGWQHGARVADIAFEDIDRDRAAVAVAEQAEGDLQLVLRALRFPALSAGATADSHVPVLRDDDTFSEAVDSLRESGEPIPSAVLVLNRSWQVVGSVTAGRLLVASAGAKIRELGVDQARTVPANVPVASLAGDKRRLGQPLAVVDTAGAVVGVLTERALRDAAKQGPASPTMHLVASAGELYWLGLSWVLGSFTANPRSPLRSQGKAGSDD